MIAQDEPAETLIAGCGAVCVASQAVCKAGAALLGLPLYKHIAALRHAEVCISSSCELATFTPNAKHVNYGHVHTEPKACDLWPCSHRADSTSKKTNSNVYPVVTCKVWVFCLCFMWRLNSSVFTPHTHAQKTRFHNRRTSRGYSTTLLMCGGLALILSMACNTDTGKRSSL